VFTFPERDSVNRLVPPVRSVRINSWAASQSNGQYFSKFRFRTSLTGETEYEVNGFVDDRASQTGGPTLFIPCVSGDITFEITYFETGYMSGFTSANGAEFQTTCVGVDCAQCAFGSVYGWGFDVYYDQFDSCNCNPLP
jgi:hypothetical protein